jgi:homoserine dehydrogenase
MKKLGPLLTKESHGAVISIFGFGGVGKTTIATALYRDSSNQFDCQVSVTVSQNYDEDQILRDILGQIKPRDREQEQQDHSTGRPAEENLAAGTKAVLVKRLVPLISRRDSKQELQDHDTGRLEKNLAAGIKPGLAKRLVTLFRGHRKQGNDGGTQWTQSKIENMTRDQLIQELQSRLQEKRYL